jgi:hypothetical protein
VAVRPLLEACLASGAELGESLTLAASALGREGLLTSLVRALEDLAPGGSAMYAVDLLKIIAAKDPELARMGLHAWGRDRLFHGYLFLDDNAWITSLPEGMRVEKTLKLQETGLKALPARLRVGEHLELRDVELATIPEDLWVEGDLYLPGAKIGRMPLGPHVGGSLSLNGATIGSLADGFCVERDLTLSGARVATLPAGLTVKGELNLERASVTTLPCGLSVGQDLRVAWSAWDGRIPDDAQVGRFLYTNRHFDRGITLADWRRLYPYGEPPLDDWSFGP